MPIGLRAAHTSDWRRPPATAALDSPARGRQRQTRPRRAARRRPASIWSGRQSTSSASRGFPYLLLGAASRRFRGAGVACAPVPRIDGLALAVNVNRFVAAGMAAVVPGLGNRAGYFIGVAAPIGGG